MKGITYSKPRKPLEQWCTQAIRVVGDSTTFAEFEPGDATRYSVLMTKLTDHVACNSIGCAPGSILITLLSREPRTIVINIDFFLHYSYVAEKLGMESCVASAITMCEIISHLTGIRASKWSDFEEKEE